MAEMVSSAVVQETVSQILSGVVQRYEKNEESNANRDLERLEMAHIRLQAALETSDKWQITDASMLRWRRKLKHAAEECDSMLQKWKKRILEDEQMEQEVRNFSFPKWIAHATKSFIFSSFSRNSDESSRSIVRRFEWFADGASEFLRFIELGGTPRHFMPFDSLIRHLFTGKKLQQKIVSGNGFPLFLLWVPFSTTEYGLEASLIFIRKDSDAPEGNFYFGATLQISESMDIIGITIKSLQLFEPHFKSIVEIIRKELTQLPTQDFSWVPFADSLQRKHWDNLHSFSTQWFRPDSLCCKQHDQHKIHRISNLGISGLPDISLDPVNLVILQCQVSLFEYRKQTTSLSECKNSPQDHSYMKTGLFFTPHGSSEDMLPAGKSSAVSVIYGKEKHCLNTDITLEQLKESMLPKAIDYFHQNPEATVCQMLWKSRHGTAYIQVEQQPIKQRTFVGGRKRKLLQLQDQELGRQTNVISQFLDLWVAHAPVRLRGSIAYWTEKEKEIQLAAMCNMDRKGN